MKKIRITNKAPGPRGAWISGKLEEIASGATRTFSGVTDTDVEAATGNKEFRVQSADGDKWQELGDFEAPDQRQWLVVARDSDGNGMRRIPLDSGEWFLGTAIASEEPEKAGEYSYAKIGGASEVSPVTEEAALVTGDFVPLEYLNQSAAKLEFEGRSQEVLEALLEAEKSDEGKQRKGVIATLEDMLTSPADEEPTE